jgi:putative membrane protein
MNTRQNNLPLSLLTMAIFGLSACNADDRGTHASETTAAAPSAASAGEAANDASASPPDAVVPMDATADAQAAMPAEGGMGEDEALGVLNAINEHEISAGEQALEKGVEGGVADYARMMIEEHGRNREQTTALGADAGSPQAQQQTEKGRRQLAELGTLEGDAYRQGYVQAMVAGHTEALASLDQRLIPAATSEDARAHLQTTREHVARHLELARELQRGQ